MHDLSVLYVEDDLESLDILRMIMEFDLQAKHIHLWENSSDFVMRLERLVPLPNLILLDIHVQPLSGFEMLEILRHDPRFQHVPIVALTASVMNEEVQQLRVAGFSGVIAKPLDMERFPRLIQRILNGEAIWTVID